MTRTVVRVGLVAVALAAGSVAAGCGGGGAAPVEDSAETVVGERLFRETRFARHAFDQLAGRDVNRPLRERDPVLDTAAAPDGDLPGPYAGLSMNCAACHLVDELAGVPGGGARTYGDFARRSPVPARGDGRAVTPRNSPPLVGVGESEPGGVFHFDGEFATLEDLVAATLTGRNFGWLPGERALAVAHVARVVREDDGTDANAQDHGGHAYATLFVAPGNLVDRSLLLAPPFRLDVHAATDEEVLAAVSRVIAQYVRELAFRKETASGLHEGSPFDVFLRVNGLPRAPATGESALDYARRLRAEVAALSSPRWVDREDGRFVLHPQAFRFGPTELAGLRTFLAEAATLPPTPDAVAAGGVGACVLCHTPPRFTDDRFHNVGIAQKAYDALHGAGAFAALPVPGLAARNAAFDLFLPPTAAHPDADGPFLDVPSADRPGRTDLGLWNVVGNPDVPGPQPKLRAMLLAQLGLPPSTTDDDLLPRTLAWFKTPSLRDLGQSAPWFHDGSHDTLEDVVAHYAGVSAAVRAGLVRNPPPELVGTTLTDADVAGLVAFLRSLNEDYD